MIAYMLTIIISVTIVWLVLAVHCVLFSVMLDMTLNAIMALKNRGAGRMTEFKTQTFPKENRHCLQFETDNRDYFLRVQAAARECIDHKPLTNFERIKTMTVEELIDWCRYKFDCPYCPAWEYCGAEDIAEAGNCKSALKIWLEKEVQENDR